MKKGKLIAIDGIDGSGKATQVKLLAERLKKEGFKVKAIDFPRYYDNFFGKLIGEYLSGLYGDFTEVDPRIGSLLYAADRFESSKDIKKWLDDGYIVLSDRYTSANEIHQGGKIFNQQARREFLVWLEKMEYGVFNIPKPDLTILLDVPFEVSKHWLENKITRRSKKYLKGRRDVAEDNLRYLKTSRECSLWLAIHNKTWAKIECCKGMVCMSPDEVGQKVFEIVKKKINLAYYGNKTKNKKIKSRG
ncbi:MAG: thymidylate kinase [Patescibacteria group bacterium]